MYSFKICRFNLFFRSLTRHAATVLSGKFVSLKDLKMYILVQLCQLIRYYLQYMLILLQPYICNYTNKRISWNYVCIASFCANLFHLSLRYYYKFIFFCDRLGTIEEGRERQGTSYLRQMNTSTTIFLWLYWRETPTRAVWSTVFYWRRYDVSKLPVTLSLPLCL